MKVVCILLAAGSGRRFGEKKQFFKLKGEPVFQYSLNTLNKLDFIDEIVLVLPEEDVERVKIFSFKTVKKVIGGKERQESVYNAIMSIDNCDIVVVHDAARPFATEKMFKESIENVKKGYDGSITAVRARDTIKRFEKDKVVETLNRDEILIVQTPQAFDFKKLKEVHIRAKKESIIGTDDSYLMEKYGYRVTFNSGSLYNIKITTKEDIKLAECLLFNRRTVI